MTNIQASELGLAAQAYKDSGMAAYMDGYADGMSHEFDISRGASDDAYYAGYAKAVKDEQVARDMGWLEDVDSYENQPGYAERNGQY